MNKWHIGKYPKDIYIDIKKGIIDIPDLCGYQFKIGIEYSTNQMRNLLIIHDMSSKKIDIMDSKKKLLTNYRIESNTTIFKFNLK